jgi:two-component sensor histidine kinase
MPFRALVPETPPSPGRAVAVAVSCLVVAGALRWMLSPLLQANAVYLPFLAAALIATLEGGLLGGVATAVLGGILGHLVFVGQPWRMDFTPSSASALITYWGLSGLVVAVTHAMALAIRRERALNEQLRTVTRELDHRAKNMLTVIQSVIRQTEASAGSIRDFRTLLEDRLQAVSAAQSLLSEAQGRPIPVGELVRRVFAPFALETRLSTPLAGPELDVSPDMAVALALLLHELATNATKHGALSTEAGKVSFTWEKRGAEVGMRWQETGGPRVELSGRRGFGTRLFKTALPPHLGVVEVRYAPEGLHADVTLKPAG